MQGHNTEHKLVLKSFKKKYDESTYFQIIKKSTFVNRVADEFNKALEKVGVSQKERIYFVKVLLVRIKEEFYMLEAYIEGQFQKYTNNFSYVNESVPLATAFSHFSYELLNKRFMVVDL
mmetsp:Transcript_25199/g.22220  ORF Transcript_25199/g.22220 Transcript_25199/m.22220 type:complete len:119 (-) Transcript_25199:350-706(-)